ncbi:MAG: DUF1684 domain-containing protein [Chitinophagaceae bacterium]|nr:DUF1684 domain-containing protein [Chitinophagaceae bacterium]
MITLISIKQRIVLVAATLFIGGFAFAQKKDIYTESIKAYQKIYIDSHEVVKGKDTRHFHFFPINKEYHVSAYFERIYDTVGFTMNTSAGTVKYYYKYGRLDFMIDGKECLLYVYQGKDLMQTEQYKDYLFVPFTDATTGNESYGSGRYLEFYKKDIENNSVQLDFNKAYNPYCAYATGYKCPVPPRENRLTIPIKAGEMNFGKAH